MILMSGNRSMATIPQCPGGRWVGVINISWTEPHICTPWEHDINTALINHVSSTVESYLLMSNMRKVIKAQEKAENDLREKLAFITEQNELILRQRTAIQELSTPVLQLWKNVLALPIIGVVDSSRCAEIMERLLFEITEKQAHYVILDITGVEVVDTKTADHFVKMIRAAELLGSSCLLTGIRPAVAQTLVEIGVDLSSITTLRNLEDGLQACLSRTRKLKVEL